MAKGRGFVDNCRKTLFPCPAIGFPSSVADLSRKTPLTSVPNRAFAEVSGLVFQKLSLTGCSRMQTYLQPTYKLIDSLLTDSPRRAEGEALARRTPGTTNAVDEPGDTQGVTPLPRGPQQPH